MYRNSSIYAILVYLNLYFVNKVFITCFHRQFCLPWSLLYYNRRCGSAVFTSSRQRYWDAWSSPSHVSVFVYKCLQPPPPHQPIHCSNPPFAPHSTNSFLIYVMSLTLPDELDDSCCFLNCSLSLFHCVSSCVYWKLVLWLCKMSQKRSQSVSNERQKQEWHFL